jgi:pilus assembly protein Flp/PilA
MQGLKSFPGRLLRCRRAATAVEYGLILALVVLAMISALIALADTTTGMWKDVSAAVHAVS